MMSAPSGSVLTVNIRKQMPGGLGFHVKDRRTPPVVIVSDVVRGGPAYGLVEKEDIVLRVNTINLTKMSYQDALQSLRAIRPGETASLVLKVRQGFTSKLETTFDSFGNPTITRVTEPLTSRVISHSNGKISTIPPRLSINNHKKDTREISEQTRFCSCLPTIKSSLPAIYRGKEEDKSQMSSPQLVGQTIHKPSNGIVVSSGSNHFESELRVSNGAQSKIREEDTVDSAVLERLPAKKLTPVVSEKASPQKSPIMERKNATPTKSPSTNQPSFHTLKNWETGDRINDSLFLKAKGKTGCTRHRCIGSVMNPDYMTTDPRKDVRTKEEKLELAEDFIRQYYGSMKRKNPVMEQKRLTEVSESIEKTGTYKLTEYELIFGAKTAWRNAPRCIGRIQWNKLQVFDQRHVDNTAQMFEAICNHLKYATNKGNIRSCITFFPPRTDYKKDFRVWSGQLILYAGYKQPDGKVIGDPNNVEFTELCVKLGWTPKGGRFDILPLVLQAHGEDPDLYEIPKDIILEVQLRHPKYDWFKDLGLKWVAVPAVSNMLLDIGGVEFPAAPFNGWFMGSEIGRDLCDAARYNVLEEVAVKLNLDTKNTSSLWKDLAFIEFNIAVLYSFQTDRITIMDHHAACESFMKHFKNEVKTRGGINGDWVWLNPPISPSLTPIFHQEILNYALNPSCQYQPSPWKYHVWKGGTAPKMKKAIRFKELAKSVLLMSSMMGKAMANRVKCTILYATETGKSLEYAKSLQDIFNHAFAAKVVCMEDYDIGNLEHETLLLVVTSTFGNGDPPENGLSLGHSLLELSKAETDSDEGIDASSGFTSLHSVTEKARRLRRESSVASMISEQNIAEAAGFLSNLRFSVFGLGSRAYPHFCAFAHAIDALLGELKGERLLEVGEGDELCGQEESFRDWAKSVFQLACETFCVGEDVSSEAASKSLMGQDRSWSTNKFRVALASDEDEAPDIDEGLSKFHKKNVTVCEMVKHTNLQSKGSGRKTLLVELECPEGDEIKYHPGDHLGIYPCNQPEIVDRVLDRLSDDIDRNALIQLQMFQERNTPVGTIKNWVPERLPICSLRCAFERYLDITSCPTPLMLKIFSDCATDAKDKARLLELSEGKSEYEEWKFHNLPNLPEVLDEFKSVKIESSLLLSQLPPLQCRYYSISSSPAVHPSQVHLTVAVVSYNTQGGEGPLHYGVCSSYLDRAKSGAEICCFIRPAQDFRLPPDQSAPILLIGPGTGIAPFRSFWEQRIFDIEEGKSCGEMALLFGCRHPDHDHLYKDEIMKAAKCGAITRYETAFSRLPGKRKQYVQHLLKNQLADVAYDWLVERNGHLYICGDVTMADCVKKSLVEIFQEKCDESENLAFERITRMKEEERFHEDIFGVTLRTFEVNNSVRQRHMSKKMKK